MSGSGFNWEIAATITGAASLGVVVGSSAVSIATSAVVDIVASASRRGQLLAGTDC